METKTFYIPNTEVMKVAIRSISSVVPHQSLITRRINHAPETLQIRITCAPANFIVVERILRTYATLD